MWHYVEHRERGTCEAADDVLADPPCLPHVGLHDLVPLCDLSVGHHHHLAHAAQALHRHSTGGHHWPIQMPEHRGRAKSKTQSAEPARKKRPAHASR